MLSAYYSKGCDSAAMFEKLDIGKKPSFRKHLNKYNTIFINVQELLSRTNGTNKWTDRIQKIVLQDIQNEYPEIDYFDKDDLSESMQDVYEETS